MDMKYFNMLNKIEEQNIDITKLYILSCFSMPIENGTYKDCLKLNWQVMEYIYDCWLQADTDLDLAKLSAVVCDYWEDIQNNKILKEQIIDMTLS